MPDESTKKHVWNFKWFWLLLIFTIGFTYIRMKMDTPKTESQVVQVPRVSASPSPVKVIFDVPKLIGKSMPQIDKEIGPSVDPTPTPIQVKIGITEWQKSYTEGRSTLLVTYDLKTNKVKDFFVNTDNPSGSTNDKERLMKMTNVKTGEARYSIEYVPATKRTGFFTGIKIVPAISR